MGVEFNAQGADGYRKVKDTSGFQQAGDGHETFAMALNIQGISVATQPEVFQGMETGYGIAAGGEFRYRVHEVGLTELDVGMIKGGAHPELQFSGKRLRGQ